MYKQLSNKGIAIKQYMQQKTDNGLLRLCFTEVRFI